MKNTTYTFTTKDGQSYSAKGNNRFSAQLKLETAYGISLAGATYTESYKMRTIRIGTV